MTLALLIPVKDLSDAKHRLAPLLAPAERAALARLMLEGVLDVCAALPDGIERVMVTTDASAMALARERGFTVLEEERQRSESDSVDYAAAVLEGRGVTGMLRVPLDLPLLRGDDLERILALAAERVAAVLVPSRDGTGTNGLFRSPPSLFPSRFGPGSLALHTALAREREAAFRVLPLDSLALDIDEPADVAALLEEAQPCPARSYLEGIGVRERLKGA